MKIRAFEAEIGNGSVATYSGGTLSVTGVDPAQLFATIHAIEALIAPPNRQAVPAQPPFSAEPLPEHQGVIGVDLANGPDKAVRTFASTREAPRRDAVPAPASQNESAPTSGAVPSTVKANLEEQEQGGEESPAELDERLRRASEQAAEQRRVLAEGQNRMTQVLAAQKERDEQEPRASSEPAEGAEQPSGRRRRTAVRAAAPTTPEPASTNGAAVQARPKSDPPPPCAAEVQKPTESVIEADDGDEEDADDEVEEALAAADSVLKLVLPQNHPSKALASYVRVLFEANPQATKGREDPELVAKTILPHIAHLEWFAALPEAQRVPEVTRRVTGIISTLVAN